MRNLVMAVAAVGILAAAASARADDAKKYEVKVTPSTAKVGQPATARFQIDAAAGSHVSDEAPLKIKLSGQGVKVGKDKLTTADIVAGKGASPKFEVPFVAEKAGEDAIEAKATFIVCTKELCEREQENIRIPVTAK